MFVFIIIVALIVLLFLIIDANTRINRAADFLIDMFMNNRISDNDFVIEMQKLKKGKLINNLFYRKYGYVRQPTVQQNGYVQQPTVQQSGYVQQPTVQYNGYVQQPTVQQNGYVQQPTVQQNGYVQQPTVQQSGYVQQPTVQQNGYVQQPQGFNNPVPQKKPINTANVMLITGVIFVLIAGLIFATTTWSYLPSAIKVTMVALASVVLFSASVFARKKTDLKSTPITFYTLGSAFAAITILTIGFFNGREVYFSLENAPNLVVSAMFFVIVPLAFIGCKLFSQKIFIWIGSLSLGVSIYNLILSFHLGNDICVLLGTVYCGLLVMLCSFVLPTLYSKYNLIVYKSAINLSVVVQLICMTLLAVFSIRYTSITGVAVVILAFLYLSRIVDIKANGIGAIPFAILLLASTKMFYNFNNTTISLLYLSLSAVIVYAVCIIPLKNKAINKKLIVMSQIITAVATGLNFAYFIIERKEFTAFAVISIAILMALTVTMTVYSKFPKSAHIFAVLLLPAFGAVLTVCGVHYSWINPLEYDMLNVILSIAMFFALRLFTKRCGKINLHTKTADIILMLTVLFIGISMAWKNIPDYGIALSFGGILGFIAMISTIALKRNNSKVLVACRWLYPIGICALAIPICMTIKALYSNLFISKRVVLAITIVFLLVFVLQIVAFMLRKVSIPANGLDIPFFTILCVIALPLFIVLSIIQSIFDGLYLVVPIVITATFTIRAIFTAKADTRMPKVIMTLLATISATAMVFLAMQYYQPQQKGYVHILAAMSVPLIVQVIAIVKTRLGKQKNWWTAISLLETIFIFALLLILTLMAYQASSNSIVIYIAVLGLLAEQVVLMYLQKENYLMAVPTLLLYINICIVIQRIVPNYEWLIQIVTFLVVVCSAIIGRLLFTDVILTRQSTKNMVKVDWLSIFAILPCCMLWSESRYKFTGFVALAVLVFMQACRGNKSRIINNGLIFGAMIILAFASWTQDVYIVPMLFRTELTLLPIAIISAVASLILFKDYSKLPAFCISIPMIFILFMEAITYKKPQDAIILGVIALIITAAAFVARRTSWFTLGVITLFALLIYETRDFWLNIAWWLYLMAVGVILIALAIINEASNHKLINAPKKIKGLFKNWHF